MRGCIEDTRATYDRNSLAVVKGARPLRGPRLTDERAGQSPRTTSLLVCTRGDGKRPRRQFTAHHHASGGVGALCSVGGVELALLRLGRRQRCDREQHGCRMREWRRRGGRWRVHASRWYRLYPATLVQPYHYLLGYVILPFNLYNPLFVNTIFSS